MARPPVAGSVVIPNCMEVKLNWSTAGHLWNNVVHGVYSAQRPINPALPEQLFSAIKAAAGTTAWMTHLNSDTSLLGVSMKDLHTPNQAEFGSTGLPMIGTGTGVTLPLSLALVVTLRTAQAGQGYRGRVYLCGLTDADLLTSTRWSDAAGTAGVGFVDALRSAMDGNTVPMCVAQRALAEGTHHDGTPWEARPAGTPDVVSCDIANPRIDSQRRRLGR